MKRLYRNGFAANARAATVRTFVAALLAWAAVVRAEDKESLTESFAHLYGEFGHKTAGKLSIISGPRAVTMSRNQAPGKQWVATTGNYELKLTIQDGAGRNLEELVCMLDKLPAAYVDAAACASGDGEDGIAVYADPGGTVSLGGKGSIDILPTADAFAITRAIASALAAEAVSNDETMPNQWAAAVESDKVSISNDGGSSWDKDIAAFAQLYAVCLCARETWLFDDLQRRSPKRFALWTAMLGSRAPILGETPAVATVSEAQIAEAQRLGVPVAFTNSLGMKFVLVPAGTFMMGSRDPVEEVVKRCNMPHAQMGWFIDEHPRHEVTLTAFYMSIHEITQGQYAALVKPSGEPRTGNWQILTCPAEFLGATRPALYVGWDDAGSFLEALSRREAAQGRTYSLPTEAQWEYACRAGSTTPFSFGETLTTDQANYDGASTYADGETGETRGTTVPAGSLPANAWGLHEMHGNVSEWCRDWYDDHYSDGSETDPTGPQQPPHRDHAIRGGSWRSYPGACRSACRLRGSYYNFRTSHIGFRAVCALPAAHRSGRPAP